MLLRLATPEDARTICAIWNPIIRDTVITFNPVEKSEAEVATMIAARADDGHATFVLQNEGHILGFASYSQFRGGLGYARSMEHTIHLAPDVRGKGIGGLLLEAVLQHAAETGKRVMMGAITAENTASLKLHKRYGFFEAGRLPDAGYKFGQFHTLVLMQKLLDAQPLDAR